MVPSALLTLAAALPEGDTGGPGYVVAALVATAVVILTYLVIVAFRVRNAANRLDELERRTDEAQGPAASAGPSTGSGSGGDAGEPADQEGAVR